jgi:two-component system NarL family sensor kinase
LSKETLPDGPQDASIASLSEQVQSIQRETRRLFEQLVSDERRFRSLARSVWRTQEEERRRLAGEVHDGLGQMLTALKIQLERLHQRAASLDDDLARELSAAASLAHRSLEDARRLSHLLRPRVLDDLGLAPALAWLARTFGEGTGFDVRLELDEMGDGRFSKEVETLVFRITQEALTNAVRHSGARTATVRLLVEKRFLRLRVVDEGCGFEPDEVLSSPGEGLGLPGLRDRVELFGGRFAIRSRVGRGTAVEARVPVEVEEEAP